MTPKIRRIIQIPPLPSANDGDFEWPSTATIANEQLHHPKPPNVQVNERLFILPTGQIWIPSESTELQLRLLVIAHTSASVHRGPSATISALESRFHWDTLEDDAKLFVSSCIHCLSTTGGEKVPRPFGPALFGTKPNDLLQFNYLTLGKSVTGDRYVLMMRDDHSGYAWLHPTPSTNGEEAAQAIIDWCAELGPPSTFMSDRSMPFRNEFMRLLARGLKCKHHFTQAYCP